MKDIYPSGIVEAASQQRGTFVEVQGYGTRWGVTVVAFA